MSTKIPVLFNRDTYIIDEKVNLLKFGNTYNMLDTDGQQIGVIEQKVPGWQKLLSLAISRESFPYSYHIENNEGNIAATIKRGWTFFMSKIEILDSEKKVIGIIKEKFKLTRNSFTIENATGEIIATIKCTDAGLRHFLIADNSGTKIGTIEREWKNTLKQIATQVLTPNKDKYCVTIEPQYTNDPKKIVAIAGSIVVDMTFKNKKI